MKNSNRKRGENALSVIDTQVDLLGHLDLCGAEVARRLDQTRRSTLGQFLTPAPVARLMASMFDVATTEDQINLLDPGAGIGTLFTACVEKYCMREPRPKTISVTAYEIEPLFLEYLEDTVELCKSVCAKHGIEFYAEVLPEDFVTSAASMLDRNLPSPPLKRFTHVILNPPYHKIQTNSRTRKILRGSGIETSNIYTAFLALTSMLLVDRGQMVSITPRSFCNGVYFKPFRKQFLAKMNIERLHLFHSRTEVFREDGVLQENVIMSARKGGQAPSKVIISSSYGVDEEDGVEIREVCPSEVVSPHDEEAFIQIVANELESRIAKLAARCTSTLESLGLQVSTGRVVDFRAREFLLRAPREEAAPLIYPAHVENGFVRWPVELKRKPERIMITPETAELLLPSQNYVLVKRFSSKEERRRIVAAIYDSNRIQADKVGFENHVNYFHLNHEGMELDVAKGLAAFLNSTIVDTWFRQFSGHTQVNASDLRRLRYPNLKELKTLGGYIGEEFPSQEDLDRLVEKELSDMSTAESEVSPVSTKARIDEAKSVLKDLGMPPAQQNERSALTLLALLDLKPSTHWKEASDPLIGITPMMEFFSKHYEKTYAPNTRETVRRQTVHQFRDAGLIVENPDEPTRPTNSPKAVYQIEKEALKLIRSFRTPQWEKNLRVHLTSVETLRQRYAQERKMKRIPVRIGAKKTISLSPGGQNILVKQIIKEFAPRFTPGAELAYVGDTEDKFAHFDEPLLESLGVEIEVHGKMPDVIIYYQERNWLVLVEAVTSHGPVNPKRRNELKRLFQGSSAGLVFVTAFLTRKAMMEFLGDISWETEVWVAESPSHLIHFNGERFLGPYES